MKRFYPPLACILLAFLLSGCMTPEVFVEEERYFNQHIKDHPNLNEGHTESSGFSLNFVTTGDSSLPAVLFIHGTPGNWRNASRYLMDARLQSQAHLVAIDRPGWGESELTEKNVEPSFASQAALIKPLLQKLQQANNGAGTIIVGHSLGASIAPRIAMDHPELVDGMILISGSLDPELGKPRWYNFAASMGVVSWFIGPEMRRANREIMPLREELMLILPRWAEIEIPVTVIQGLKDELVYPENADFAERVLINADTRIIRLPEGGHFIPWEHRDKVTEAIIDTLGKIR